MKKAMLNCVPVALLLLAFSCAPTRLVKVLEKDQKAVTFSFGGPVIKFAGAAIPIPFSTLTYGQGITSNCTGFGSLHITSLLFGNVQADAGAVLKIFEKEKKMGVTATPGAQIACKPAVSGTFRLWPSLDVNYYLHFNHRTSFAYGGMSSWIELAAKKAHSEDQSRHLIPNLHLGYTFVHTRWQHQFEVKYLGLGIPNTPGVVDYIGVSGKGTLGIYYCVARKF
jgi:hypothetical protein